MSCTVRCRLKLFKRAIIIHIAYQVYENGDNAELINTTAIQEAYEKKKEDCLEILDCEVVLRAATFIANAKKDGKLKCFKSIGEMVEGVIPLMGRGEEDDTSLIGVVRNVVI